MITPNEVEMLGQLLSRAGVNPYEAEWANRFLNRLRALVAAPQEPPEAVRVHKSEASPSPGHKSTL